MAYGRYNVVSNDPNTANSQLEKAETKLLRGLGSLIQLPRELRDMIYPQLMACGHVSVLQASSALNLEASKYLSEHGICRLIIGDPEKLTINPSRAVTSIIQNVDITVSTHCAPILGSFLNLKSLASFGGPKPARNICVVTFVCWPTSNRMVEDAVLQDLKTYTGFEKVVISIRMEWSNEPWPKSLYDFDKRRIWNSLQHSVDSIDRLLKPTFGDIEVRWDFDVPTVVFRPRKQAIAR